MGLQNMRNSDKFLRYFIIIAFVFSSLSVAYPILISYLFTDLTTRALFDDPFEALNTLFSGLALAGVMITILIQRKEMRMQQDEMQETRKEFLLNRTSNLLYSQLDRFEKALNELKIKNDGFFYYGNDAITFLDEKNYIADKPLNWSDSEYHLERKKELINQLKIYNENKNEIEKFAGNANNSVNVLKRLIFTSSLDVEELNDLKNIFFDNIGFINMGVIVEISSLAKLEFDYLESKDYLEHDFEVGLLTKADVFLKDIIEFYKLRLSEDSFFREKEKWRESLGGVQNSNK